MTWKAWYSRCSGAEIGKLVEASRVPPLDYICWTRTVSNSVLEEVLDPEQRVRVLESSANIADSGFSEVMDRMTRRMSPNRECPCQNCVYIHLNSDEADLKT
jgi:hypothetical protein